MVPQLALVGCSLAIGWASLWPIRTSLGPWGFHGAAMPTGLLAWSMPAIVAIALHREYSPLLVLVSIALWIVLIAGAGMLFGRPRQAEQAAPQWWTFALVAAAYLALAALIASWGIAVYSHDGWAQYTLSGWLLHDAGEASHILVAQRMLSLSAIQAAYATFGGEFDSVVFPTMALATTGLVALGTLWASERLPRLVRGVLALGVVTLMATTPTFAFMSLYFHSHMITAMFLLLAVIAVWRGTRDEDGNGAWIFVAGLAATGVVLARPDGPAYVFIIVLTLVAAMLRARCDVKRYDAFFLMPALLLGLYTVATIIQRGMWTSSKISAMQMLEFAALYVIAWAVLRFVPWQRSDWLTYRTNTLALILSTEAIVIVWVFRRIGMQGVKTLENMLVNLLQNGGWRSFWWFMAAFLIISVALKAARRDPFTGYVLFAASQFAVIALIIHGVAHPGRLGWGDSFNRVAFHAVPLLYLYLGMHAAGLMRAFLPDKDTRGTV